MSYFHEHQRATNPNQALEEFSYPVFDHQMHLVVHVLHLLTTIGKRGKSLQVSLGKEKILSWKNLPEDAYKRNREQVIKAADLDSPNVNVIIQALRCIPQQTPLKIHPHAPESIMEQVSVVA